jgi:hypothetical protein
MSGGSFQQRQPLGAERDGNTFKPVHPLSREAGRQIELMLVEDVHRKQSPVGKASMTERKCVGSTPAPRGTGFDLKKM